MKQNMEYDMELQANGRQYGVSFERNGKLFQDDDIDYNIYGFYINGKKVGEFGHTYPKKATFNIDKYLPIIEKMIHNEGFLWGWEKADAIDESNHRTVDLRDPDDYIPYEEYDKFEEAYKMRLYAKANELQRYVDDTLAEKSPISVRYKETMHLGVLQPHILVNNNGQFLSFTDCDKAEKKVKELVDMEKNKEIVKISESQLRNMIAESVKGILNEIGDTPAGQWMLGRLAGRQRNREYPNEISSYTLPMHSQGKISKTTTDANDYGDDEYDSPFQRGFDLENNKWRDNYPDFDLLHADEREESLRGYGDAMTSMIQHHSNKALKESNNNQYICQKKVRLTEGELRSIIRKVIEEAVDESGYLQGAHKATLDNLNRKKDMGVTHTIRPKGGKGGTPISIPNSERLTPLDTHNEDMNRDFFEQYGKGEQIIIPFSVELNNSFIYNFDFVLKQIENIDNRYMSIIGDMTVTKTIGNPKSFMNAYCPRITSDVVLKYDFGAGILKFTRNPKGLAIRPAQNSDGTNNNRWNELILYANDYNKGKQRYSRL